MQRSILFGLVAVLILLLAGAGGIWWKRQNGIDAQWVQMPINPASTKEEREQTMEAIRGVLLKDTVLQKVGKELDLQTRLGLKTEEETVERLKNSLFVREGEITHALTQEKTPSIDIGVNGKSKERAILGEIAISLANETSQQLGLKDKP
jgi:uncharacterized protein YxeA